MLTGATVRDLFWQHRVKFPEAFQPICETPWNGKETVCSSRFTKLHSLQSGEMPNIHGGWRCDNLALIIIQSITQRAERSERGDNQGLQNSHADGRCADRTLQDRSVSRLAVSAVLGKPLLQTTVVSRPYKKMSGGLIDLVLIETKANGTALSAAETV